MKIADFLGKAVSNMLQEEPFKNWPFDKSVDDDLEETITNYVFIKHGLALSCDADGKISSIFLYSDKYNGFDESLFEIPFSLRREQVLAHFGIPAKSGKQHSDPILGEYGEWDRFTQANYVIHIEYRRDCDGIKMITLMRLDVAP